MDQMDRRADDRRQDHDTAAVVSEALACQRAFGNDAAQRFLKMRGVEGEVAQQALLDNYDRRKQIRRTSAMAAN
ncbi:hypothetical protein ACFSQU_03470 [Massilia sp. GCM10020059]|uniref:Uncharacterized protein n=1 Tax=Massilia agrisoli TaxID=2892444 RepID=A0ABS8IQ43_9BURK|nr:hypothetical protein [Massilia agrisoli]MCC6069978.1 hypothetical protein [Massilia agrisoli]